MKYDDLVFKIPKESKNYRENSNIVVGNILSILEKRVENDDNKIIINKT